MSNDTHGDQRRPLCLVVVEQQHGNTTPTIGFFDTSSSDIDPFGRDRTSRAPADIAECDVSDTPPCPLPRELRAAFYRVSMVALYKTTDEILLKTVRRTLFHNEISSRLLDLYKCMTLEFSHEAGTIWPPPILLLTSVLAQQWFGTVDHECSRLLDFCNTLQILPIQTAVVGHVKQRLSEGSSKFGVVGNST
ncbi:hypothetical protein ALC56_10960 [Trachymyrmex septentrionalis]|uniref:Uncharacterized protein n=1 Tax=Trachymyrmex septentrionalis TaxID=34720 RepID=A0A195F1Y0_9HYME|nr:hypothetical protein ALC56_10960 [Trachymyrmex septentrionalis]